VSELDFNGKTVLVVGGSSGIGNGIAQAFRARGAAVTAWGTRPRDSYRPEDGSDLTGLGFHQVDAADFAAVASAPDYPTLDVLILAQGLVLYSREEFKIDAFRRVVDVNLNSLMACAEKFYAPLEAAHGAVIILSSNAAFRSARGNPAYTASKTGAVGLTRTLGQAWASRGIRVNGIAPGWVRTKMTEITFSSPERTAAALEAIPMRRFGLPEDIASVALFLASPLAAYVVGETISVSGGVNL
jgi:3-oxoacyl-[acyl-carrier protein] reductase